MICGHKAWTGSLQRMNVTADYIGRLESCRPFERGPLDFELPNVKNVRTVRRGGFSDNVHTVEGEGSFEVESETLVSGRSGESMVK